MKTENKIRLEIRKLVSEVFGKSMGLGSGFDDEEGQKPTKMHNWLGSKISSRKPYTAEEIVNIIGESMIDEDWDMINNVYVNLSTKNKISPELQEFASMLGDAIHNNNWHEVSVARKFLKDNMTASMNEHFFFGDEEENTPQEGYNKTPITSFEELKRYKQLLSTDLGSADYFFKYLTNNDLYLFTPSNPDEYIYVLSVKKDSGKFNQGVKFKHNERHENINKLSEIPGEVLDMLF